MTIAEKDLIILSEKTLYELFRESNGNTSLKFNIDNIFKLACLGTYQYTNQENNIQLINQIINILQKEKFLEKEGEKKIL